MDLWRRDEVLNALLAHPIAELRVPELGAPDPLLLLLHPAPALECESHGPLEVFVGDLCLSVRVEELEQPI